MTIEKENRTIFESSRPGAPGYQFSDIDVPKPKKELAIPQALLRKKSANLPALSEIEVVRHYTHLSRRNFCIDLGFYPLGSCTMKYNPKLNEDAASMQQFQNIHPLQSDRDVKGILELSGQLLDTLCKITGMAGGTLQPMAGAQGEFAGMKIFKAVFGARGESNRTRILVPDSSHGTNPASAHLSGFEVITIPSSKNGLIDPSVLDPYLDDSLAGIMLTNPSTLGLFESGIQDVAEKIHSCGALLYYDGANLNAVMGRTRPGDMGFDVVHINLHKTFSTPHGGGGPGAGPVLVQKNLLPYLPVPVLEKKGSDWVRNWNKAQSIGKVAGWYGNTGVLVRAYSYILAMGGKGLKQASDMAVLNANYLLANLKDDYHAPYPGPCKHEFVLSAKKFKDLSGITALDVAKGLIEHDIHPPTIYFPLIIPECLMIEPTETETLETLDRFISVMKKIADLARQSPQSLREMPCKTRVRRIDEVRAARHPVLSHMMLCDRPDQKT